MKKVIATISLALFAATSTAQASEWHVEEEISLMDDSKTVVMILSSNEKFPMSFGQGSDSIDLIIRCSENSTAMYFVFNGHHMADIQGLNRVTMRVDDAKAVTRSMSVSTDNKALGKWSGSGIGIIKTFFNADNLVIRATPYSESPITATFNISGIEDEITPLREACSW